MNGLHDDDLRKNVGDRETWLRFVYLVAFGIILYLSMPVTFAVAVFQFLAKLFSGAPFASLTTFGANLATYQMQLTRYLALASDDRPFPFAPFPASVIPPAMPFDTTAL